MALLGVTNPAAAGSGTGRQVHVVYAGQRLGSIAKRYNVSIEAICQANGIRRRDPIHPGQRLEIPSRAEARAMAAASAGSASATPAVQGASEKTSAPKEQTASKASAASVAPAQASSKGQSSATGADKAATTKAAENKTAENKTASATKPGATTKGAESKTAATSKRTSDETPRAIDPLTLSITRAGVSHQVKAGESLSAIAVHYGTTVKTLLAANNLRRDQVIRVGQVIVIPKNAPTGSWWAQYARAPRRPGEIEVFAHHAHSTRWKGKVLVNGKVQPAARTALSRLLGATGSAPPVPERLLALLAHVSDTFGGRPIRLVSGYRTSSYVKDSRHRHSSAIDFSIPGVPNSAVRDYLLQLGNVGVGYYPNSTFVHLDVRARSAYWVDYAGPGEAPRKTPRPDYRMASNSTKAGAARTDVSRKVSGVQSLALPHDDAADTSARLDARPLAAHAPQAKETSVAATAEPASDAEVIGSTPADTASRPMSAAETMRAVDAALSGETAARSETAPATKSHTSATQAAPGRKLSQPRAATPTRATGRAGTSVSHD